MVRAVLFDPFETLVTESLTRPPGVSSLASKLGCEREAFRMHWQALRPAMIIGRMTFRQAVTEITTRRRCPVDDVALCCLCDERIQTQGVTFRAD